jgi:general secretion pathway protein G
MIIMKNYNKNGFTIVELLVVIVVIGILASITIVSFSGISQRATTASLQSDLENASKLLKMDLVDTGSFPSSTAAANNGDGIPASSGTTYQYTADNSTSTKAFCITATKSNLSYYSNQDSKPIIGGCPGDLVLGSPSLTNPSFESDAAANLSYPANWNQYGMVGNIYEGVSTEYPTYGTKSFKISHISSDMDGGIWGRISGLTIGQDISVSAHIRSGAGVVNASLVLCTAQHGLTGGQTTNANQNENVNGRFTATINNVDQTAVDVFLGQGSFGSASRGDVWFDGLQVTVN